MEDPHFFAVRVLAMSLLLLAATEWWSSAEGHTRRVTRSDRCQGVNVRPTRPWPRWSTGTAPEPRPRELGHVAFVIRVPRSFATAEVASTGRSPATPSTATTPHQEQLDPQQRMEHGRSSLALGWDHHQRRVQHRDRRQHLRRERRWGRLRRYASDSDLRGDAQPGADTRRLHPRQRAEWRPDPELYDHRSHV